MVFHLQYTYFSVGFRPMLIDKRGAKSDGEVGVLQIEHHQYVLDFSSVMLVFNLQSSPMAMNGFKTETFTLISYVFLYFGRVGVLLP